MTVDPTSGPGVAQFLAGQTAPTTTVRGQQLGKDAFLKLLVAQLRYQDPSKPVDSADFLAQTAQFQSLEKLTELSDLAAAQQQTSLAQQRLAATALVGRTVVWTGSGGVDKVGVVDSVRLDPGKEPLVQVGTDAIPMSEITEIRRGTSG